MPFIAEQYGVLGTRKGQESSTAMRQHSERLMPDSRTELERLQFAAAECEILAGLAKDDKQRIRFQHLADHYRGMINRLEEPTKRTTAAVEA